MIRAAVASDADFIESVYREHKKQLGSFNLYYCWYEYLNLGKGHYDVLPGAGFVRYGWSPMKKIWVLHDLGVINAERGNGYGKLLMARVPKPFVLKCNFDNDVANKFYRNQGLQRIEITRTRKGVMQNVYLCAV